jgi:hypothetical protein
MRLTPTTTLYALAALATASLFNGRLSAAPVVFEDFESYADQAAVNAVWVPIVAPGVTWTTAQASSPTHSVQSPANAAAATARSRRAFTETGTPTAGDMVITWAFDYWDVGTTTAATPYRQYANLQDTTAPSGTNQLISMGMNNNHTATDSGGNYLMARILGYNPPAVDVDGGPNEAGTLGSGAYFKLNDFGTAGLRTAAAGWRNLRVAISTNDGASVDYEFYVDGILAERVSNVGTAASIRSYDNITLGSGVSAPQGAFFDDVELYAIPEPSTFVMAALGLVGCLAARRRTA